MVDINKLVHGYRDFHKKYFQESKDLYQGLVENGQAPKTLIIACSDSRVDPATITNANPGEIFVIRNVANLIPPFQQDHETYHGTSAALEFAINNLSVENIIVLGHSQCAGIKALIDDENDKKEEFSFVREWVKIANKAKYKIVNKLKMKFTAEEQACCEKEALKISLENLKTYPWIKDKVNNKQLDIHAWYFDLKTGEISYFDQLMQIYKKL